MCACVRAYVHAYVRACVRAYVHAYVRACVRACHTRMHTRVILMFCFGSGYRFGVVSVSLLLCCGIIYTSCVVLLY